MPPKENLSTLKQNFVKSTAWILACLTLNFTQIYADPVISKHQKVIDSIDLDVNSIYEYIKMQQINKRMSSENLQELQLLRLEVAPLKSRDTWSSVLMFGGMGTMLLASIIDERPSSQNPTMLQNITFLAGIPSLIIAAIIQPRKWKLKLIVNRLNQIDGIHVIAKEPPPPSTPSYHYHQHRTRH